MSNQILQTGWKHWDMYLSKFVGKKINCLDIGSSDGTSTCWMLNNLCSNPYSRVFSVDIWDSSIKQENHVSQVEKTFDEAVNKTGRKDQNIKMKMTSTKALLKLKEFGFIIFDFIFINASPDAKNVITDAVLSWDILNEDSILIFNGYKWDKVKEEEFRPKLAIDSFVSIYKLQLNTLHVGYQYIIEKINSRVYSNPEVKYYYKLIDEINRFKYFGGTVVVDENFKNNVKLDFKLDFIEEDELIVHKIKEIDDLINTISYVNLIIDNSNVNNLIKNMNTNNVDNINIVYKIIILNKVVKYLKHKNHVLYNGTQINNNDLILLNKIHNIDFKYYVSFNNIFINNIETYKNLIKIDKKYDILIFESNKENTIIFKYIYPLFYLIFGLNVLNLNGSLIYRMHVNTSTYLVNQIIYLLKKYYKTIKFVNSSNIHIGLHYDLHLLDFIGINKDELNNLNNLIFQIFENNDGNINSIINNNNNIKLINDNIIYNQIYNYYISKLEYGYKYIKLFAKKNKLNPKQQSNINNILIKHKIIYLINTYIKYINNIS